MSRCVAFEVFVKVTVRGTKQKPIEGGGDDRGFSSYKVFLYSYYSSRPLYRRGLEMLGMLVCNRRVDETAIGQQQVANDPGIGYQGGETCR